MKEDFLHYVWQYQYFLKDNLRTTAGEEIVVRTPGLYNRSDAGPDFSNARILLGDTEWVGSVELHLLTSDWQRHRHQQDAKYNQVVLHVVWEEDESVQREEGTLMPTLELKGRVDLSLQAQYQELLWSQEEIPCAAQVPRVDSIYKSAMMEKTLLERLQLKADLVQERLTQTRQDWESTVYQTMAAGFGFKINQQGFSQLTQVLPLSLINRYRHVPKQLEALVFGQAGLLVSLEEQVAYLQELEKEHQYLTQKHSLSAPLPQSAWNYLRLRPANFPAIRVGQWLAVLQAHHHLWADLVACDNLEDYFTYFRQSPPAYWQEHYAPGRTSAQLYQRIGDDSIQGLLINVVAPLLVAYSRLQGNDGYQEKAVTLLERLVKEQNKITRIYTGLGFPHTCAADSQALLGLYQNYCAPKKCLHCSIGHRLLKQNLSPA
ncbi:hypothetical protein TH63_13130 [Rufibacter radiotolerans]|uniref:DUF2851 family protein n=1 Tax=Rufibacter radiotolerans TaxID=1379910 RepID=A0A0H4VRG3_9BACT|nr:DUF2851 family protein [Rufibacter radiotolerans]AKQ46354.1 hypothetical protein TH63_13130 [Rufibacter radiotolerans]